MLVRSSASDKILIQKMIPQNKYYKNCCNNETLHISCLLFIASYKVSEWNWLLSLNILNFNVQKQDGGKH